LWQHIPLGQAGDKQPDNAGNRITIAHQTEGIVKLMPGDDNGVVNVLEPHPSLPILATSGLDDEVKLWMPNQSTEGPGHCWQREQKEYMQKTVQRNLRDQELNNEILWAVAGFLFPDLAL